MNPAVFKYVILSCLRDKTALTLIGLFVFIILISLFLGSTAVIESGPFSLAYGAGLLRLAGVAGLALIVTFSVRRLFEMKEADFILACPVTRPQFTISVTAAFGVIAFILSLLVSLVVLALFWGAVNLEGMVLWSGSIVIEYVLMSAVSVFFAMVITSGAGCVLIIFGFYILSRMLGQLLSIASGMFSEMSATSFIMSISSNILDVLSYFIPRLDLLAQSSWLLYGLDGLAHNILVIWLQAVLFIFIFLTATVIDTRKRQF